MRSHSLIREAVMLSLFLIGALGGACAIYYAVHKVAHAIPRRNADRVFV